MSYHASEFHPFFKGWLLFGCMYPPCFIYHSSMRGRLSCFHSLAIAKKDVSKVLWKCLFDSLLLVKYIPRCGMTVPYKLLYCCGFRWETSLELRALTLLPQALSDQPVCVIAEELSCSLVFAFSHCYLDTWPLAIPFAFWPFWGPSPVWQTLFSSKLYSLHSWKIHVRD